MQRISLFAFVAVLVLGPLALAGEECGKDASGTEEKIAKLLQHWKAAAAKDATGCDKEKARLQGEFAAVVKDCPLGSRMGATLGFVDKVLEASIGADAECAKSCASASSEAKTKSACKGAKLVADRGKLLVNLRELTTHALAVLPAATCPKSVACASAKKGFCEKKAAAVVASVRGETCKEKAAALLIKDVDGLSCKKKAAELASAIRTEHCAEKATALLINAAGELKSACGTKPAAVVAPASPACAKKAVDVVASGSLACAKGPVCCAASGAGCASTCGLASGAGCSGDPLRCGTAIRACWKAAGPEYAALCPKKKKSLQASVQSLGEKSPRVALLPPTILALSEGFDALESYNAKMASYEKAHPEALKAIPADTRKIMERQFALLREGAEVLRLVRTTMQACIGAEAETGAEGKTETASAQ